MSEASVQSVLRCGDCNKPFDKESSLKRHGYYCRSRKNGVSIRSRSCLACAKGKVRCDNKRPQCSRCIARFTECRYPASANRNADSGGRRHNDSSVERQEILPPLDSTSVVGDATRAESSSAASILDDSLAVLDPALVNLGENLLGWDGANINLTDYSDPQTNDEAVQHSSEGSLSLQNSTPSSYKSVPVRQAHLSPDTPVLRSPANSVRSLIRRPQQHNSTPVTTQLILHTLKSYPLMMLRHDNLPPFIHPHQLHIGAESNGIEPLTNCMSLVHMVSRGVQGSRKLFWRNVRLECERLCAERLDLNKRELTAAMQALLIYVLIRMGEGETVYNNFDFLLITTVTAIATQLNSIAEKEESYTTPSASPTESLDTNWGNWIFQETITRMCLVYQVVNMLIYFEPAAMCSLHAELALAPLPANKQLWEADDQMVWRTEIKKNANNRATFGLSMTGELVRLNGQQQNSGDSTLLYGSPGANDSSGSSANWEEWCSGMDSLGGLVMLAASLV